MVKITDVGGHVMYINLDLIEKITTIPDTLISLLNGTKIMIKESPEEIIERIVQFRRRCNDKVNIEVVPGQPVDGTN